MGEIFVVNIGKKCTPPPNVAEMLHDPTGQDIGSKTYCPILFYHYSYLYLHI